jgi:large repetitive protein
MVNRATYYLVLGALLFAITLLGWSCFGQAFTKRDIAWQGVALQPTAAGTSDVTEGLVGWWKFDEGTGTEAADSSGNSHTGTLTGSPVWSTRKTAGDCLYFAANTDYVEIANPGNHLDGSNFTVCAWACVTNAANTYMRVLDRVYNGQLACYVVSSVVGTMSGVAAVSGSVATDAGSKDFASAGPVSSINSNVWAHLAWVYDGTSATLSVFTNGVLSSAASTAPATNGLKSSTSIIRIAQRADAGGNRGFVGWLDDVRLYSRALNTNEISTIYSVTQ